MPRGRPTSDRRAQSCSGCGSLPAQPAILWICQAARHLLRSAQRLPVTRGVSFHRSRCTIFRTYPSSVDLPQTTVGAAQRRPISMARGSFPRGAEAIGRLEVLEMLNPRLKIVLGEFVRDFRRRKFFAEAKLGFGL